MCLEQNGNIVTFSVLCMLHRCLRRLRLQQPISCDETENVSLFRPDFRKCDSTNDEDDDGVVLLRLVEKLSGVGLLGVQLLLSHGRRRFSPRVPTLFPSVKLLEVTKTGRVLILSVKSTYSIRGKLLKIDVCYLIESRTRWKMSGYQAVVSI